MNNLFRALGAGVVLVVLLVAPPLLLVRFVGNPWPAEGIDLGAPLTDGALIGLLAVIVWALWLQLVVCVVLEAHAALTGRPETARIPLAFGFQQQLARRLVTTIVVAAISTPVAGAVLNAAAAAPQTRTTATASAEQAAGAHAAREGAQGLSGGVKGAQSPQRAGGDKESVREAHADVPRVVVHRGDTLWSIAERHLGSGERWPEIAAANEGEPMSDGSVFRSADLIQPGWELALPGGTKSAASSYTVRAGDTLSGIAQDRLGDADAYPSIARASHLEDPDLINPGQKLTIPGQKPAPAQPPAAQTPAPEAKPGDHQVAPTPMADSNAPMDSTAPVQPDTDAAEPTPAPKAEGNSEESPGSTAPGAQDNLGTQDEDGVGWPVRTAGGIGAFLAAGLVSWVAYRRRVQQRHRQPGHRIPMPEGPAQATEQELRAVEDPLSVELVDQALRVMAHDCAGGSRPLPQVRAARLTAAQFDLYLAEPAILPAPWQATTDEAVWTLAVDAAHTLSSDDRTENIRAPYPALVTIGHDVEDGLILLNLEHLEALTVVGQTDLTRAVLAALTVELATCSWSEDLDVSVVGAMSEFVDALDTPRVRYVPTGGEILDHPEAGGRRRVVLVAGAAESAQQDAPLAQLGHGTVGVTTSESTSSRTTAGEWVLQLSAGQDAVLHPLGLPLRAQMIDSETCQHLVDVMKTTATASPALGDQDGSSHQPGLYMVPPDAPGPAGIGEQPPDHGPDQDNAAGVPSETSDPPVDHPEAADPTWETAGSQDVPAPRQGSSGVAVLDRAVADVDTHVEVEAQGEAEADLGEPMPEPAPTGLPLALQTGAPVIRLLGPVPELVGAAGELKSPTHRTLCTELAAYIALNPAPTATAVIEAVWAGRRVSDNTRRTMISRLRTWLGTDADGQLYFPRRGIEFAPAVRTDWQIFTEMVGTGPQTATTEQLEQALALVHGRMLVGVERRTYAWAETDRQDMIAAVVDVSYELARRRLMEGRWRDVERAAALGVLIEPGMERLWRVWILAAHSAGNPPAVAEARDRMHARIGELGFELEPETEDLIRALEDLDADGIERAMNAL